MSIWETMNEDATQLSGFFKPEVGKINQIRIITDPIRGTTAFKTGDQRIQYQFVVTTSEKPNGFNPYRVFKFVATQPSRSRTGLTSLFQSLSGFQVRCNIEDPIFFDREEAVSIPIGFSSSLQLGGIFFFRANKS